MAGELRLDVRTLSRDQRNLHSRAQECAVQYQRSKADLLDVLKDVDRSRLVEALACGSTHQYCRNFLNLSESTSYAMTTVNRKCRSVPELRQAVREGLALSKAHRICSVLTAENKDVWIERAKTLSKRELDRLIANASPRAAERETLSAAPGDRLFGSFYVDQSRRPDLERAQVVLSNKLKRPASLEEVCLASCEAFLEAECPVRRADRNAHRPKLSVTARVDLRDRGRCRMTLPGGEPCGAEHFVEHHHLVSKFRGGRDELDNFITLCRSCHQRWHLQEGDVPLYKFRRDSS